MDHFKFRVNVEGKISKELLFPVTVQWLKLTLLKNTPLEISSTNKKVLDSDYLQATTGNVEVAEQELYFKLLIPPKKGKLLLGNEVLKASSIFSQKNITDSKISYEPQERSREDLQDSFSFLIVVKHIESEDYIFRINLKADKTRYFNKHRITCKRRRKDSNYKIRIMCSNLRQSDLPISSHQAFSAWGAEVD